MEGLYQVRGLDLSNMTIVEGDTGVIVIDPLISTETAAAGALAVPCRVPVRCRAGPRRSGQVGAGLGQTTSTGAFASHHWPTWGRERVVAFLSTQRDLYAYLHDQTLRLLNRRSPSRCD